MMKSGGILEDFQVKASRYYSSESDAEVSDVSASKSDSCIFSPAFDVKSSSPAIVGLNPTTHFAAGWKPVIDGKVQIGCNVGISDLDLSIESKNWNQQMQSLHDSSSSPVNQRQNLSVSPSFQIKTDGNDSDSDMRRVPEFSGGQINEAIMGSKGTPSTTTTGATRKRGPSSADKEHKRMKRLLRNRVSAQQARERKKAYLSDLETRSKELERRNGELEEKLSTLQRENYMLRQIVKNTAIASNGSGEVEKIEC